MIGKLIQSALRILFAWIDGIISNVITLIYNLLTDLAQLILYSDNVVKAVGSRIGLILGVFMLFRIAVSLINYMISPDTVKDNNKGGAKLITNVVVSLVLLATINIIFEQAYNIQLKIIDSQIIEKIFFGESSNTKMDVGYYLYSGFFTPNVNKLENNCPDLWDPTFDLSSSHGQKCISALSQYLDNDEVKSITDAKKNLKMSSVFSNYSLVLADDINEFIFDYQPIISTAAGVAVLLILISFSMELAKRAIKLLFLQIIAPVPIVFNIDPGKGKDVFKKWYKECFSTYLSVFFRLVAINFAVFMIVLIKGNFKDIFSNNFLLNVFIIIGCLMFAKEVPKLIENMFGIKTDGMSLHPIKKFEEQALFGKQINDVGRGAIGSIGGAVARFRAGGRVVNRLGGAFAGIGMGYGIGKHEKTPLTSSANGVYKRLVGTDFVNFSFSKSLLGLHAKTRVQEIKDARNAATEFLNEYNTQLSTSEALTSQLISSLSKKGIDVSDIGLASESIISQLGEKENFLTSNQAQYTTEKAQLEHKTSELREAQSELQRISDEIKRQEEEYSKKPNHSTTDFEALNIQRLKTQQSNLSSKVSEISSETESLSTFVSQYEAIGREVESLRTASDELKKYSSSIEEQNELRSRIAIVQKDIDDLSSEKSQRERFYGYDPSPAPDIKQLRADASQKDSYRKRVDDKYNKSKAKPEQDNN